MARTETVTFTNMCMVYQGDRVLVLDRKKFTTIPILIQYFKGSFGRVEMGPMMACIMLTVLPIIIIYLFCQKHIIKGIVAGAVKG